MSSSQASSIIDSLNAIANTLTKIEEDLEIHNRIQTEICHTLSINKERNITVPRNLRAVLAGVTDLHQAATNMLECAAFSEQSKQPLTYKDFYDALGTMIEIADLYYIKKV